MTEVLAQNEMGSMIEEDKTLATPDEKWDPHRPPSEKEKPNKSGPITITTFLTHSLRDLFSSRRTLLRRAYEESLQQLDHDVPIPLTLEAVQELFHSRLRSENSEINLDEVDANVSKIVELKKAHAYYVNFWVVFIPSLIDIFLLIRAILQGRIPPHNAADYALAIWGFTASWFVLAVFGLIIYFITAFPFMRLFEKATRMEVENVPGTSDKKPRFPD